MKLLLTVRLRPSVEQVADLLDYKEPLASVRLDRDAVPCDSRVFRARSHQP